MTQQDICNLSFPELQSYLREIGEKSFRAKQVFEWIYQKGAASFEEMKNLPQELRQKLDCKFQISNFKFKILQRQQSFDGTTKFLFELHDNERIETVLIPAEKRNTVCVSTQAGCKFGCKFCASGVGGFKRNLTTAEIVSQILYVNSYILNSVSFALNKITHVVFMGIGEPLDNWDAVMKAIAVINDPNALGIGARRITVSTCGLIPQIKRLEEKTIQFELAVSLHGFDNASRDQLMPINKIYPFDALMRACREYAQKTRRQITFEYLLIKDLTCTEQAAQALRKAFRGIICKLNLIPFNRVEEFDFVPPTDSEIKLFQEKLEFDGVLSTLRQPRGKDIAAACGQLRLKRDRSSCC